MQQGCPVCGQKVSRRHVTGPNPVYCGPSCRRNAEYERRRHLYQLGVLAEKAGFLQ